ncbi:spore germination protein [Paenibacillus sp. GCM10012307]|uniref:Spore germination protein n=1 Tax=Paenibacillus roseus TaxID=2798579 RepID=A0A934MQ25_9BACL|nr:spore germination protein [Paenibacillus roseus]MBJ6361463.1 spore germination protein [Paenibacillus roseus]
MKQMNNEQLDLQQRNPFSTCLATNLVEMRRMFDNCDDIIILEIPQKESPRFAVIFASGLINTSELDRLVINKLNRMSLPVLPDQLRSRLAVSSTHYETDYETAVVSITSGNSLILIDGCDQALAVSLVSLETRGIEEPAAETVVRGPREGFVEQLTTNCSLLRRRLKSPAMKIELMQFGRHTHTSVALVHMQGIADESVLAEVRERLDHIDIDGVLDSMIIEEMIEDQPFSPFPQLLATERPDVVCSCLLEGRIAVLVDGSPFALIGPITLFSLLQSPEDYYQRTTISSAIRWLRYLYFGIALTVPSLYVAVLSYHQEMIPAILLFTIAESREHIPFPALIEALLMEITFEGLREAGIRLPKQVGSAVSIVGALVIGQAAIAAGIVSSPMVMVVAITGIASFMIPNFALGGAIRLLRFPVMICSGILGLYGLMVGIILILTHLLTLRSLGVPYLSPFIAKINEEWKDTLVRAPKWQLVFRPRLALSSNRRRIAGQTNSKPKKRMQ